MADDGRRTWGTWRRRYGLGALLVAIATAAVLMTTLRRPGGLDVETSAVTRQTRFVSTASASGEIVATRYADIGSSAMGKIVSLPVTEGARVKAGQLLARIDAVQARSDAAGAAAQVAALEAEERAAREALRSADADLAAAEARARDTAQQFTRRRDLHQQGLIATGDFDSARAADEAAAAQVKAARAVVERSRLAGDAAARRVAQARAQVVRARDIVSKTEIVSPIDGVVTRLLVREGEMVVVGIQNQPGTTLMTISDLSAIDAEVKVAEADVLRLAVGQPATVTLDALPDTAFAGRVVEIGASALPVTGTGAAAREFKVVVRLDAPRPDLRPGLTCDVEITTAERKDVLTVPLQSVVLRPASSGQPERTGVFAVRDGKAVFSPVTTGVIGGLDVEISGVPEGAQVVTGPYQVLRELADGAPVRVALMTR